jgi:uncharacterized protein (UPF0216 family)
MSWPLLNTATLNKNSSQNSLKIKELECLKLIASENDFKIKDLPIIAKIEIEESSKKKELKVKSIC